MRRQLLPALRMLVVMTVLAGILYTAAVTVVAQGLFAYRANGSLVEAEGRVVGSEFLGQPFERPEYFHPRPSAVDYDPRLSGATNYGPGNPDHLDAVADRAEAYRQANQLEPGEPIPVDAVTASASGLDPHISLGNARLQAPRVAEARGLPLDTVLQLIDAQSPSVTFGSRFETMINVLVLNLALDDL